MANAVPIFPTIDLPPGWIIQYNSDGAGWVVIDQFGRIQVSQAIVIPGILALSAGTQLATSGTIAFGNSNGVTFGMSGSSLITASVNAIASVNLSAGTTSENLTNFVLSNSNNVSFGLVGSTVTASASFSQSTAPGALAAGTQTATSGTVVFANSNGVTFGMSGSSQVTASFAQSMAPAAISAGTTLASSGTVVFSNSNGVSFGLAGNTVTASVASTQASVNLSAGTTSNLASAFTFSNSNNVSFGLNDSIVTASAAFAAATVTAFSQDAGFVTNFVAGQGSLSLQKLSLALNLQATQLVLIADFNGQSGASGAVTISHGVYTLSGETARLASSAARMISWGSGSATSASTQFGGVSGTRYRTIDVSYGMTPGDYLFAWWIQTTGAVTCTVFGRAALNLVGVFDGVETNYFLNGISTSAVGAFPSSLVATDTGYVRTGFSALRQPGVILIGTH